jgi:competence protein ComER
VNVAIVGAGVMGSMLVRAHARFAPDDRFSVRVANRTPERLEALAAQVVGLRSGDAEALAADADLLFLCLTPGPFLEAAARLARRMPPGAVFVSITNAVSLDAIAAVVDRPIVKVVPSLAHDVGRGVALLIRGPGAGDADVERVRAFMAQFATVQEITQVDARIATNLTGCGPALIACFAELLAESAAEFTDGLTPQQLRAMIGETLAGAGALVAAGRSLEEIVEQVATPGGSTQAALAVLRERLPGVLDAMHQATSAKPLRRVRPDAAR